MIEVSNLSKRYGDKLALDSVSFTASGGQVLGLLGLNGAGKTTTMNIITGYLGASSGTVLVNGFDVSEEPMKAKKSIGYLPEQPPLYLDMRVSEYLDFVWALKKAGGDKAARIQEICQQTGIAQVYRRVIKNLSKGYRQRVGLAQALIGDPAVLVLDEPTVGLDPSQIIEIRSLIKELGKTRTIIVSSHILPEVREVCDRVVVLHQGKTIADDTPDALSRRLSSPHQVTAWIQGEPGQVDAALAEKMPQCSVDCLSEKEPGVFEYVVSGREGSDIRAALFRTLAGADLPMLVIRGGELSLEDIFLKLIGKEEGVDGRNSGS